MIITLRNTLNNTISEPVEIPANRTENQAKLNGSINRERFLFAKKFINSDEYDLENYPEFYNRAVDDYCEKYIVINEIKAE